MTDDVVVIGSGMMGSAIVKSLLKSGYKGKIIATDFQQERVKEIEKLGIAASTDNRGAAADANIIFIVVKPPDVEKVLKEIRQEIANKLVISVAATVPLKFLKKNAPEARFVRIMPNVAALVQASYTAYSCDADVTEHDKAKIKTLLNMMGICAEVNEVYMDAITALSGSGPGYLSIIIEALMDAGLRVGLPRDIALSSAAQTVMGTGKLVLELQEHPAKIRDMVTTPGGTTIEAIYELEGSQIRQALMRAIEKATKKCNIIRDRLGLNLQ
ncbi:MAG: pyrroline-5-carboxylate reductase [Candidatus Bathyarchaeia archaeon]